MSIFMLLLVLAVIGAGAWALITYVPMPAAIRTVIIVVAVLACIVIALQAFGIRLPNPTVPQVR